MRNLILGSIVMAMLTSAAVAAEVDSRGCPLPAPSGDSEVVSNFPCAPEGLGPGDGEAALPPGVDAGTDLAYCQEFSNGRLGHHQLNDFQGFVPDGNLSALLFATDFDRTATTLYALDSDTKTWGTVNLTTGVYTSIGASVPSGAGHNNWSGLAIHPVTGVVYASAIAGAVNVPYGLYSINPATGAATLIGQDAASMAMIALAINCNGQLYGHDIITDSIYSINTSNGAVTLIGPTGFNSNFAQGMDFDNTTNELYAWTYQGGGANRYGTINLATGALTTLSSSNPTGEFEGAIKNVCAATTLFNDGFELGTLTAWSGVSP